jgi:hypothetical protein
MVVENIADFYFTQMRCSCENVGFSAHVCEYVKTKIFCQYLIYIYPSEWTPRAIELPTGACPPLPGKPERVGPEIPPPPPPTTGN